MLLTIHDFFPPWETCWEPPVLVWALLIYGVHPRAVRRKACVLHGVPKQ